MSAIDAVKEFRLATPWQDKDVYVLQVRCLDKAKSSSTVKWTLSQKGSSFGPTIDGVRGAAVHCMSDVAATPRGWRSTPLALIRKGEPSVARVGRPAASAPPKISYRNNTSRIVQARSVEALAPALAADEPTAAGEYAVLGTMAVSPLTSAAASTATKVPPMISQYTTAIHQYTAVVDTARQRQCTNTARHQQCVNTGRHQLCTNTARHQMCMNTA